MPRLFKQSDRVCIFYIKIEILKFVSVQARIIIYMINLFFFFFYRRAKRNIRIAYELYMLGCVCVYLFHMSLLRNINCYYRWWSVLHIRKDCDTDVWMWASRISNASSEGKRTNCKVLYESGEFSTVGQTSFAGHSHMRILRLYVFA